MTALEQVPSRVKYYLLDYKDSHMDEFSHKYGPVSLDSLTLDQLRSYYYFVIEKDKQLLFNIKTK